MELLTDRHKQKISGVLSCYDRVVITGTLPEICYSQGMTTYLYRNEVRIFDYPKFAEPFREELRTNAEKLAGEHGVEIEFVGKSNIRKESLVQKVLLERGDHPGLVHILSAMESCPSYKPWHDKRTHKTFLRGTQGKCLHYYFYFIDEVLGLGYVRVPTWCPFGLQVYFNGHNWLASKLRESGLEYELIDNAFTYMSDWGKAQELANELRVEELHGILDRLARSYAPVFKHFNQVYHWSIMQAEYATDIVFKRQKDLQNIYSHLVSTAIHVVKAKNIATFLGKKQIGNFQGEIGNRYNVRIEGSRIKHQMGNNSIKMYDKFAQILRIETTTNKVSFFKHYRKVEHIDGTSSMQIAAMKKNIYSLVPLKDCMLAANRRYLEFISTIEDRSIGTKRLKKVTQPIRKDDRNYKGFNFFEENDRSLFEALIRGEFNISGFRSKDLRKQLPDKSPGQIYRILKRLRLHGIIRKVGKTYKYYLTKLGKVTILNALKLNELILIPDYTY